MVERRRFRTYWNMAYSILHILPSLHLSGGRDGVKGRGEEFVFYSILI